VNLSSASQRHFAAAALLAAVVLAVIAGRADAADLRKAVFDPPTLTTEWALDSGDCAGSVAISDNPAVGPYGYFSGWHAEWDTGGCLTTSNARTFDRKGDRYYVAGHPLSPATYWVQVDSCRDSDFSGNYFCRASNVLSVHIPSAVAGTLSNVMGDVSVNGSPARDGTTLHYGDVVSTGSGATVTVNRSRGGELELREGTSLVPTGPTTARLRFGKAKAYPDGFFRMSGPNASGAADGGVFKLAVTRNATRDRTYSGSVAFSNTRGTKRTVVVEAGYQSTVRGSDPPTQPRRFQPPVGGSDRDELVRYGTGT